jgi:hypothetical protein
LRFVFFTSPVSGGAAVGDGGNLFFGSRMVSSDHQSGQVCLFRGIRLLAIEVIKVSVPLLRS